MPIDELFGVRTQTPNNIVCAKSSLLSVQVFVKKHSIAFLGKSEPDEAVI